MKSFKWLHFSDLHLSCNSFDSAAAKKRLLSFIQKERKKGNLDFDYVFISGDVANKAIYSKAEDFTRKLFYALDLKNDAEGLKKVFWSVGNHDIVQRENERSEIIQKIRDSSQATTLAECLDDSHEYMSGVLINDGMQRFKEMHLELLKRPYDLENYEPHKFYDLPELNLIVLNTCLTSVDKYDPHNLYIKSRQLREVFERIKDEEKPIFVLGHHGRDFFAMEDMDELGDTFDDFGVDLYLCGHNHRLGFAIFPDAERDIYQLTCGGAADFSDGSSFSFIHGQFDANACSIRITPYSYRERGDHGWGKDERLCRRLRKDKEFRLNRLYTQLVENEIAVTLSEHCDLSEEVNVLHLSDLQFGITAKASGKKAVAIEEREAILEKRLIPYLQQKIPQEWKPDIIVISGDLAWSATAEDYKKFGVWLKELLEKLKIPIDNVILCTGNHDISKEAAIFNTSNSENTEMLAHQELVKEIKNEKIYEKFKEFIAFSKGEIDEEIKITPLENVYSEDSMSRYLYGYRDLLGIRFNVLNTSWYCGENRMAKDSGSDKEKLWIGESFVRNLEHQLVGDQFAVTVFHHPFEWLNDEEGRDDSEVKRLLLQLSDVILCGHVHVRVDEPTFEHNRAQIFQSGALWNDEKYVYEPRIIKINKRTGLVNQLTLEYVLGSGWRHIVQAGPNRDYSYPINFTGHLGKRFTV